MIILKILGGLLLVAMVIGSVFAYHYYLSYKEQNQPEQDSFSQLLGLLPSIRLLLQPGSEKGWVNQQQRDEHQLILEKNGFEHAGYFKSATDNSETLFSFWNKPKQALAVVLVELRDNIGKNLTTHYSVNVLITFTDDSTLTITNSKAIKKLPRPKEHATAVVDTSDIKEIFSQIKSRLPADKKMKPVADMKQCYVDTHESISEWLWQEKQLRSKTLQAFLTPYHITLDNELVLRLLDYSLSDKNELIHDRILKRLAQSSSMTEERWRAIKDDIVVVHNNMQAHDIVDCLYQLLGQINEEDEVGLETLLEMDKVEQPLALFEEQLNKLKGLKKIKKVATIKEPVAAVIYRLE